MGFVVIPDLTKLLCARNPLIFPGGRFPPRSEPGPSTVLAAVNLSSLIARAWEEGYLTHRSFNSAVSVSCRSGAAEGEGQAMSC
jgi:hypothetical protein